MASEISNQAKNKDVCAGILNKKDIKLNLPSLTPEAHSIILFTVKKTQVCREFPMGFIY